MASGWSGGIANRTWQRDRRSADSGRIGLVEDVQRILADWRAAHGWEPGMVWEPALAWYVWPNRAGLWMLRALPVPQRAMPRR